MRHLLYLYLLLLLFTLSAGKDEPICNISGGAAGALERAVWSREKVREMFLHGFDSYMNHGYPWDELKPLTCSGRRWDRRERGTIDDVLGGFSLTLIDSLDSLVVLGEYERFYDGVSKVIKHVEFDRDVTVSVFETSIRVLGGLLSTHLLLKEEAVLSRCPDDFVYDDELLKLAVDLGRRLLPAFKTKSGIPYHRVNLRHGVELNESPQTCSAAAGTLLMEFGLLSRLSNNPIFEKVARRVVLALWERRDPNTKLIGNTINVVTGKWISQFSGTGAGIDSYYEYLIKSWVLLDDPASPFYKEPTKPTLMDMFEESMEAVETHLAFGPWHLDHSMVEGKDKLRNFHVSSLQGFWPGLQAMIGNVEEAKRSHSAYYTIWKHFGAFPESFDLGSRTIPNVYGRAYFLRPELIESTFVLYQKTLDPYYLLVGERIMSDIEANCRVSCGFAALHDITKDEMTHEDRMDSFFLAETLKYLYMLFDMTARKSTTPTNISTKHHLFSTEGHLFLLDDVEPNYGGGLVKKEELVTTKKETDHNATCPKRVATSQSITASASTEVVLTPYLETPIHVPHYAKASTKKSFVFASAEFGRPVDLKRASSFLVVKVEPADGCGPLENMSELQNSIEFVSKSLRLGQGETLELALLVERGGCTFVKKVGNIANVTKNVPTTVFVLNNDKDSKTSTVYTMVDDGTASRQPYLNMVTSYMAPSAFGRLFNENSVLKGLFPNPDQVHVSHHLIVNLALSRDTTADTSSPRSVNKKGKNAKVHKVSFDELAQAISQSLVNLFSP